MGIKSCYLNSYENIINYKKYTSILLLRQVFRIDLESMNNQFAFFVASDKGYICASTGVGD